MAKLPYGILGPYSGKCGNKIGVIRKNGTCYERRVASHYRDAKSAAQLRNRTRLCTLMRFLSPATPFLNATLAPYAVRQTQSNEATRMNLHSAVHVSRSGSNARILFNKVQLSKGPLAAPANINVLQAKGSLVLSWNTHPASNLHSSTDRLHVFLYNETLQQGRTILNAALRGQGYALLSIPPSWYGQRLHVYTAFLSTSGAASQSVYTLVPKRKHPAPQPVQTPNRITLPRQSGRSPRPLIATPVQLPANYGPSRAQVALCSFSAPASPQARPIRSKIASAGPKTDSNAPPQPFRGS